MLEEYWLKARRRIETQQPEPVDKLIRFIQPHLANIGTVNFSYIEAAVGCLPLRATSTGCFALARGRMVMIRGRPAQRPNCKFPTQKLGGSCEINAVTQLEIHPRELPGGARLRGVHSRA